MIVFFVARNLTFGDSVQGWTSTICVMLLLGGIQLLTIGILGKYLEKTYIETKRRPIYISSEIDKILNENPDKKIYFIASEELAGHENHKEIDLFTQIKVYSLN